ncbi:uncharacterized protein LOC127290061 [Leptopilina boulardi]|uniref:uncharacterized protein LOC127290061 n=1 Tax=Leptopilina boulardi TaxID=63433 RepID=UPI0021F507EA|nr:uncharacterized protein LOC127290061 [Leptopilina boulardi]
MDNSTVIEYQLTNFQFLSVCHYITGFAYFLYNENLINSDQNQTVSVLNSLFHYLYNSKNESEAKLKILQAILKGTDFYGGGENETLDMKYVDETYHYIISKSLFSHYGNINRYLAGIINKSNKMEYFEIKKTVFDEFSQNYKTRDYCSSGNESFKLTPLATRKIFDDFIWIIFPLPMRENMKIIDVHYIYAMVGLKFISATSVDAKNLTFDNYTLIGREIDTQSFDNNTLGLILELFSAPALFFFAYKERMEFHNNNNNQLSLSNEFWIKIFEKLFIYINNKMDNMIREIIHGTLLYKLENEIQNLKSRTSLANTILKIYCHDSISEYHVALYKTLYLWTSKLILFFHCQTDDLPNLDDIYDEQFTNVEETYNKVEKTAIKNILIDSNLIEKINENVFIKLAKTPIYSMYLIFIPPPIIFHQSPRLIMNKNIHLLFAIIDKGEEEFYAFQQKDNSLTLLTCKKNEREFAKAIVNDSSKKMEIPIFAKTLKRRGENYKTFVQRVADIKTKQFIKDLKNHYRETTIGENIFSFIKPFIPFYSCIENISDDKLNEAAFSCSLDILSLIPIGLFAGKYAIILQSSLMRGIFKNTIIINVLSNMKNIGIFTTKSFMKQISLITSKTISKEILTKAMLKDLLIATLRSFDPGFEALYTFFKFSMKELWKLYEFLIFKIRKIPGTVNLISVMESILKRYQIPDHTGLVPKILGEGENFNLVKYYYPGGSNFFGPTCLKSFGKTAELRSIENYAHQLPVVSVKTEDKIFYHPYNPIKGEIFNDKFENGKYDILQKIGYLLEEFSPRNEKIIRNYNIYPVTINWEKKLEMNSDEYVNLQRQETSSAVVQNSDQISIDNVASTSKGIVSGQMIPHSVNPNLQKISKTIKKESKNLALDINVARTSKEIMSKQTISQLSGNSKNILPAIYNVREITKSSIRPTKFKISLPKDKIPPKTSITSTNLFDTYIKMEKPFTPKDYLFEFGDSKYKNLISLLNKFKTEGLSSIRKNGIEFRNFRLILDRINSMQINDGTIQKSIKLWHIEETNPKIFQYLKQFKEEEFYFNDLTLLISNDPISFVEKTKNLFPIDKTVKYELNFDNQYGVIDIGNIHETFQGNYILYPEVKFKVTDINTDISNNLILQMDKIPLRKFEWIGIRNADLKLLVPSVNMEISERIKFIELAAEFISSHVPLCKYIETKNVLKRYILKFQPSNTQVFTYDQLARDIYNKLEISEKYSHWRIKNGKFIDDVLFDSKLYKFFDSSTLKEKIFKIYDPTVNPNVVQTFNHYQQFDDIEKILRFEDFYIIHSHLIGQLILNKDNNRRYLASIYRLALRQCSTVWIKNSITIYHLEMVDTKSYDILKTYREKKTFTTSKIITCSAQREGEMLKISDASSKSTKMPVLFQITMRNQAGIADVGRIFPSIYGMHIVPVNMKFVVDKTDVRLIDGKNVLLFEIHDSEITTELRMVNIVSELNELFSTSTKFYVN